MTSSSYFAGTYAERGIRFMVRRSRTWVTRSPITTPSNFALHTQTGAKDFAGVQHLICPWLSALIWKPVSSDAPTMYIFLCALDLTSMCERFALRLPRTCYAQLFWCVSCMKYTAPVQGTPPHGTWRASVLWSCRSALMGSGESLFTVVSVAQGVCRCIFFL